MKELIKEAESLYKQIDKAQVHLINARLQKDKEGKKFAYEDTDGYGFCLKTNMECRCSDKCHITHGKP